MNSVVAATVRNSRVAELVNIYEVFLLSWPLKERMERYLLLNHPRSVELPVRSDSDFKS